MKQKNIPLLVMSLLFVGTLAYSGFHIASAQKNETNPSSHHFSSFLSAHANIASPFAQVTAGQHILALRRSHSSGNATTSARIRISRSHGEREDGLSTNVRLASWSREYERENESDDDDRSEHVPSTQSSGGTTVPPAPVPTPPPPTPTPSPVTPPPVVTTPTYTLAQVSGHSTKQDCWMAIQGKVYNVSNFMSQHPGGSIIVAGCGVDATAMFSGSSGGHNHSQGAWNLLPQFFIGNFAG